MKYTIRKARHGYIIGTGHKRKLTWQGAGMLFIATTLILVFGLIAVAVFISPKLLMLNILISILMTGIYVAANDSIHNFRIWPYKTDTWSSCKVAQWEPVATTVELLAKVLKHKNLSNFCEPDDLSQEVVTTIKLFDAGELTEKDVKQYNESLKQLIEQCEKSQHRELLGGKERHDSNLIGALEVAKKVNSQMESMINLDKTTKELQ